MIERLEERVMLSADGFIKAAGTVLRDGHGTGDTVLLQGTNLGGWLLKEGWMTPMDSSGTIPDDYTARQTILTRFGTETGQRVLDDYENSWITLTDLDNIKAMGMNVVRLPFWYRNFQNEDGTPVGSPFTRIDWLVSNAWARGIYTILDFHGLVGGQSTADHTGRVRATAEFWGNATDQQRTIDIWKQIAQHFKNNPGVAGYDLINEPTGAPNSSAVWNMYDRMYKAIRPLDPDHLIVMEGAFGNWNWDMLPNPATFGWTNVMYEMHEYQFGSTNDPVGIKAGTDHQVADFNAHKSWNVPAYVGEFNDFSPPPDPASVWAYTVQQYQNAGINWSEWSYKSSNGSGTNSWGIYNKLPSGTAVPNLTTDDNNTISSKWKAWITDTSMVVNPMLLSALTINLGALPAGFTDTDVNVAGLPGKASFDQLTGTWTLWGSGADIWGTADQFNFASKAFSGDGSIIARVSNDSNTDPWAKTGVMFRDGTGAGAVYAALMVTPGNGVTFQWRNVANGTSSEAHISNITAGLILRLVRTGNSFSAYYGHGGAWTQVGTTQSVALSGNVQAGLVTSAHNNTMLNTGTFKGVSILPAGWLSQDVGVQNGGWAGTDAPAGNTWTVAGGGPSPSSGSDSFNFTSRSWAGDGIIKAKLTSFTNTLNTSRAGLMFSAAANDLNAAFANVYLTPNNQVGFRWRSFASGPIDTTQVSAGGAQWIRLIRTGSGFVASFSADDVHWTRIDVPQNILLPTTAQVGIVVDSTDISKLSQATFSGLVLGQKLSVSVAGTTGDDSYYVRRNGTSVDIWRNTDGSGSPAQSVDVDETGTLTLNGAEGNDTFILDASGGAPLLASGGNVINGAVGNDVVRLIGLGDTSALRVDANAFFIAGVMGVSTSGIESNEILASKIGSLMISGGAVGELANGGGTLQTGTLSVDPGGQLDLRNNTLIVSGGDLGEISNLVANGRNLGTSGRWSGWGITSSNAAASSVTGLAAFSDARGVVVKYTWLGDLNGDGVVNADDYALIDGGFASHASGYANGDVDYSGSINSDDYFYMDLGFSNQSAPLAPQAAAVSGTAGPTKKVVAHHRRHPRHRVSPPLFLRRIM